MELEIGTLSERDIGTSPSFTSSPAAAADSATGSNSAVVAIADLAATSVVGDAAAASVEKIRLKQITALILQKYCST